MSARNYAGTNEPHGWIGLRLQLQPGGPPSDILLHINMRDPSNVLQQEAIGILGVNLIYAAFYQFDTKESFFAGLAQDVVRERIEIDFVDFRGPAFASWDRSTLLAYLVHAGFAEAVFLSSAGTSVPPTEVLYKKPVVPAPGYFASRVSRRAASSFAERVHNRTDTTSRPAPGSHLSAPWYSVRRRRLFGSTFAILDYKLAWHANKVGVARSGELGYTSGTYDLSFKDASGKTISD